MSQMSSSSATPRSRSYHRRNFEISDFTVYDLDKPVRRNLTNTTILTEMGKKILSDREWDEDDWEDQNDPSVPDDDFDVLNETKSVQRQIQEEKSKTKSKSLLPCQGSGKEYPIDLWYLIAMYIAPEDVARFALICRSSNHVVNTVPFWIRMFRKYNEKDAKCFGRLLVRESLPFVRHYVIRSLYQVYPLFRQRSKQSEVIQKDPHFLRSARCIRIWHSKREIPVQAFNYYFEFRFDRVNAPKSSPAVIEAISPVFQNTDNQLAFDHDSYVLHVISSNFVTIGPFMGMILSQINMMMSSDFRYQKLKLAFNSSKFTAQNSTYNSSTVIIDPILRLRLYRWFDCPSNLD